MSAISTLVFRSSQGYACLGKKREEPMLQTAPAHADHRQPDDIHAWIRLGICILFGTVCGVGMWSMVVVLPAVQADFGVLRADASLAFTMTMVGFGLGNAFIGRYVDRFGITPPLIAASIILGCGYIFSSFAQSIWTFSILQVLVGFGAASGFGPVLADISHWFERRRGMAVATAATGNYIAGAVWPSIIEGILSASGWRTAFLVVGVACIALMIPLALLLRAKAPLSRTAGGDQPKYQTAYSPRTLQIILAIAGVGCCVAMAMPQVHIVAYCVDLGFGVARGAEMLTLMLIGGIFSRLAFGLLADKIGGVRTLIVSSVMQCLSLALYIPFDGLASLYMVSLIFGLSQGGIVPAYAIIVREYLPAKEAGKRIGLVVTATVVGMALGGWMSGWIYDLTGSYQAAFLNGIGWNLLNIAMMLLILLRRHPARVVGQGLAG